MIPFSDKLTAAICRKKTPVMVGLDPRWSQLPTVLTTGKDNRDPATVATIFEQFGRSVIDIVAPLVPIIKPQVAFFEQYGPEGMTCLAKLIHYATEKGLLVLVDGKRNDIGSTAEAYAEGFLGAQSVWKGDALTVNPYLGDDSLSPFIHIAHQRGAGVFVLVKTSNPGGAMLQDLFCYTTKEQILTNTTPQRLYQVVAQHVQQLALESREQTKVASPYGNVGAVVGATWPSELAQLREEMSRAWLLVPGYGSQGGGAKDCTGAFDENGLGAIINNSRGIIFAHRSPEYAQSFGEKRWEEAIETATRAMIAALAAETTAGKL